MTKLNKRLMGITVLILIFILVACGNGNETNAGSTDGSIGFSYMGIIWEPHPEEASDILLEVMNRTNTSIEFNWFQNDHFEERVAVTLASGDLPDVIAGGGVMAQLIQEGAIIPLDDLLESYGQNILAAVGDNIHLLRNANDGHIYTIPNMIDFPPAMSMQVRQDWLDELGLDVPQTWDEWVNAWRGFQTLGDNIVPYAGDVFTLMPAFGMNVSNRFGFMIDADGNYTLAFEQPQFRSFLEEMRMLYEEGILDQEFATRGTMIDNTGLEQAWQAGVAGSAMTWAANTRTTTEILREITPEATVIGVPPIQGPNGHQGIHHRNLVTALAAITIEGKDRAREIVQFFDFLFSEDGITLMSYGIEGHHHEVVDGRPVMVAPYVESFGSAREAGLNFTPLAHKFDRDAFMQLTLAGSAVENLSDTERLFYDALLVGEPYFFTPTPTLATEAFSTRQAMVFPVIEQLMAEAIIGRISIDDFFTEYEQLRNQGLQDILDQGQEAWQRVSVE